MSYSPVGALDPARYGLDNTTKYPLNGIMHTPPSAATPSVPPATTAPERTETGEGTRTSLTLAEIQEHLMGVYVDKIGVEFMHSPVKSERL
jgi:probable 2-oxoglutarate dehydrogenase E1 component DHKTD1